MTIPTRHTLGGPTIFRRSPRLPLPHALTEAVSRFAADRAAGDLAARAAEQSAGYRARRSSGDVSAREDVLAYLLARMPATYAATSTALERLALAAPGFAPSSLLDLGAGPGTASWAAAETFPDIRDATLVDTNATFRAAAAELADLHPLLAGGRILSGSLKAPPAGPFDLVVASYALTELSDPVSAIAAIWAACGGALVLVEPGTPRDWQRLMAVRERLIRLGATMAAPCPHEHACPLAAPDWCHFAVRLERSREHMRLKGGTLGYEDEKFSYLVVVCPDVALVTRPARVLARPERSKFEIRLKLCTSTGELVTHVAPKRDAVAFRAARKLEWGDDGPA